ncbi:MAG: dTDP-4-dehydrorhamnose reductase [Chitinophagaceae bacterium]|nr:MAG: dTDP-4-dehydrorhamnose reductase [Chitinophagaceae bacterium]
MSEKKHIIVTGAGGQLASEIQFLSGKQTNLRFTFLPFEQLDITNDAHLEELFQNAKDWDVIINTAAYTAVDKAEEETEKASMVNAQAMEKIGRLCHLNKKYIIHISTDFVFDGRLSRPYVESDEANPINVYGKTKRTGEINLLASNENSLIFRTSWLYSTYGKNFFKTMRFLGESKSELKVVSDQVGTPTYALDLADFILHVLQNELYLTNKGIFHFSNEGVASWYDFAWQIMKMSGLNCKVLPINSIEYPTPAARPNYSVLDKSNLKKKFNYLIPHWQESLLECIKKSGNDIAK